MDEQSAEANQEGRFGLVSKNHRGLQIGFTAKKIRGWEGWLAPAVFQIGLVSKVAEVFKSGSWRRGLEVRKGGLRPLFKAGASRRRIEVGKGGLPPLFATSPLFAIATAPFRE
jgi:hypothetical protein